MIDYEMSIDELSVPLRIYNALKNNNKLTLREVLNADDKELLAMPNFGKKSLDLLDANLEDIGLRRCNKRFIREINRKTPNWRQLYLDAKVRYELKASELEEAKAWLRSWAELREKDQDAFAEERGELTRRIDALEAELEKHKNGKEFNDLTADMERVQDADIHQRG